MDIAAECANPILCVAVSLAASFVPFQCEHYRESIMLDSNWERAHFAFAQYLDQLYTDAKQREVSGGDLVCLVDAACIAAMRAARHGQCYISTTWGAGMVSACRACAPVVTGFKGRVL